MIDRLGLGGNSPPSRIEMLRQELQETTSELTRTRDFWLAEVAKVGEVTDAASASKATQTAADVGRAIKEVEAARVKAKEPYLEGSRAVDSYFVAIRDPLAEAKTGIERRLTVYQRGLRADVEAPTERSRGSFGAIASLRETWVHGEVDRAKLDLESLRIWFSEESIDKAIRAAIRAGVRELKGVSIHQETQTRVRG